ncbi:hypothetical protein Q7C36_009515 [Tachysurus vachellii]|uniref:Uncharacterized protein n=1 Tax=Tachysurus vachellii TaxID=175792 RepID=A0AA88MY62_TACVA|nr:hypothetical protein Q7C36_009515 [Tachysurus vachellii]
MGGGRRQGVGLTEFTAHSSPPAAALRAEIQITLRRCDVTRQAANQFQSPSIKSNIHRAQFITLHRSKIDQRKDAGERAGHCALSCFEEIYF